MLNLVNNKFNRNRLIPMYGIFWGLIFFLAMPTWATNVGYIASVSGNSSDIELTRNNQPLLAADGTLLERDDRISVKTKQASVTVRLGDDSTVTITQKQNNPYLFERDVAPISIFERSLLVGSEWFGKLWQYSEAITATLGIRGDNKEKEKVCETTNLSFTNGDPIPILTAEKARLVEGKRSLHLGWTKGQPPYRVQLYHVINNKEQKVGKEEKVGKVECNSKNKEAVAQSMMLKEVTLKTMFKNGSYMVKITDASGKTISSGFEVVSVSEKPVIKGIEKLPLHLQATWLAAQGNGEWMLEAYQIVAGKTNQSAWLTRLGLAKGMQPK